MRFASAGKFSANDYASAGRSVANSFAQTFTTSRQNAPDWTGLAKVSMGTRSAERQTAMQVEGDIATAGVNAFGNVKDAQIRGAYDLATTKTNIKAAKNSRKAGRLAGLGGLGKAFGKKKKFVAPYSDDYLNQLEGKKQPLPGEAGIEPSTQAPRMETADSVLSEFNAKPPSPGDTIADNYLSGDNGLSGKGQSPSNNVTPIQPAKNGSGGFDLSGLSDTDKRDIAYIVSGEAARGTDDIYGVAGVVINRMRSKNYPSTAHAVGHQPGQFEAIEIGTARHEPELQERLFNDQGMAKLRSALITLDGRDSFKGQTMLKHRVAAEDPMFHSKGNFYHHSWQN